MKNQWGACMLLLFSVPWLHSQEVERTDSARSCASCADQANALGSGAYVHAVMDHIWPPGIPVTGGISVSVQLSSGTKAVLHSNGEKGTLWLGIADVPNGNVWDFLEKVADSCGLPPDPADAVKILKVRWQVKELTPVQFQQLHRSFMIALSQYASNVQERSRYFMEKNLQGGGIDASIYPIIYDNTWEHFKIEEWDLPVEGHKTSMIRWVEELRRFVEKSFKPIVGK